MVEKKQAKYKRAKSDLNGKKLLQFQLVIDDYQSKSSSDNISNSHCDTIQIQTVKKP